MPNCHTRTTEDRRLKTDEGRTFGHGKGNLSSVVRRLSSDKDERMPKPKKPLVVVTRKLPDIVETRMRELFDARLNLDDKPMSQSELAETVKTADVLVPTVTDRIDASVLSRAGEKLKLIANYGNGVDHIDVATALSRGITVTNTPGVLTEDTADMT